MLRRVNAVHAQRHDLLLVDELGYLPVPCAVARLLFVLFSALNGPKLEFDQPQRG